MFATRHSQLKPHQAATRRGNSTQVPVAFPNRLENISAENSQIRLLVSERGETMFTKLICRSAAFYMRVCHRQDVLAMVERAGQGVLLLKLRALDAEESKWMKEFRGQLQSKENPSASFIRKQATEYAVRKFGCSLSPEQMTERIWMLISPIIDDDFEFDQCVEM